MATNVDVRGLDKRGFRIKNSGGSQAVVKVGTTVTVDVDDANVARTLRRNKRNYVRASAANVTLRGLESGIYGFKGGTSGALTIGTSNAAVTYSAKASGVQSQIRVAHVNPGGTAARNIVVSGRDITVNLAVTGGAINGTETATAIAAAVNADAAASALVLATAGGTGASVVVTGALAALTGGAQGRVTAGSNVVVNVDDRKNAAILRRRKDKFVAGSSNLISIKGLGDEGFRIKNSGGTWVVLRRGGSAATVNVDDGNTQQILRRQFTEWIEA